MEAQLWFSKGEKMEAWLGFSMDGVLVGCCWVTLSYKKYMGQPLTITHKPTSNHRCPLKLCCVSCPMMHSRGVPNVNPFQICFSPEKDILHSVICICDKILECMLRFLKPFFLLWMSFGALYSFAEYVQH